MNSNMKVLIGATAVIIVLICGYFLFFDKGSSHKKSADSASDIERYKKALEDLGNEKGEFPKDITESAGSLFDDGNTLSYNQIMDLAQKGKLDLVSELWKLRNKCGEEMSLEKCHLMIAAFLNSHYPDPQNKHLSRMFSNYLQYEEDMKNFKINPDLNTRERLAILNKKRSQIFGEKDAKLIFGMADSRLEFAEALSNFLNSTKNQPGAIRVKSYEKLRRDIYGDYYNGVMENESKFDQYQMETTLRENDIKKSGDESKPMVREMRVKYFGKDGADRLEKVDEEIRERENRYSKLKSEESRIIAENPSISQEEKQKKLNDLRVKILGKEEAEEYSRRENIENYKE
ncbi:MAG: lipase chaperone [Leptospira sp.]|nr:lipase chaperone [Leptospira sp.]